jgi:3-phenylpropionate/trans-cinnamate dioxygenase ferredoxin component
LRFSGIGRIDSDAQREDDVSRFDYNGKLDAVYHLTGERFYASDGLCTHEQTELSGGLVIDGCIECPRYNGRFDLTSGKAMRPRPQAVEEVCGREEGEKVFVNVGE